MPPHLNDPSSVPIPRIDHDALFVVNGGSNSITVVNTTTGEIVGTIALLNVSFPHHAYLAPDRSALAVAAPGVDLSGGHGGGGHGGHGVQGAILVLDALTGSTRAALRIANPNHNAMPSPNGEEVWTSQMTAPGSVLVLDATTLSTLQVIAVGDVPAEVTFTTDGQYAIVANTGSANVSVIDATSKSLVTNIPVGEQPVGAWPASNGIMYVDNEHDKTLSVIDVDSLAVVDTFDLGFTPGMAALATNGELWVTDTDNGKVVFFDATAGTRLGDVATGPGAHGIAFGRDGVMAYVSNQAGGTVSVIAVGTRVVTDTLVVGVKPNGLVFRPAP